MVDQDKDQPLIGFLGNLRLNKLSGLGILRNCIFDILKKLSLQSACYTLYDHPSKDAPTYPAIPTPKDARSDRSGVEEHLDVDRWLRCCHLLDSRREVGLTTH